MRGVMLPSHTMLTRPFRRLTLSFLLILFLINLASAKPWRAIVPLQSSRADVLRILGKPSRSDYIYDFDEGTVRIMYARERCEQGIPSTTKDKHLLCRKNVPEMLNECPIRFSLSFSCTRLKLRFIRSRMWP